MENWLRWVILMVEINRMRMCHHGKAKAERPHCSSFWRETLFLSYLIIKPHVSFLVGVDMNASSLSPTVF